MFLAKFSLSPPPTIILWTNIPLYASSCDSKEISSCDDLSLNSCLVVCFLFQSRSSAFPAVFCALAVRHFSRLPRPLALGWSGPWKRGQGSEGGRRWGACAFTAPRLFVMSSALAAFLDGLMFSINCPSPHHFFVSKFQWPPCLSGLWVSTGTTNSQLHCPLRFPACCPQHCRQALC